MGQVSYHSGVVGHSYLCSRLISLWVRLAIIRGVVGHSYLCSRLISLWVGLAIIAV